MLDYMYSKFEIRTFNLLNASMLYLSTLLNIELIQDRWYGKIIGRSALLGIRLFIMLVNHLISNSFSCFRLALLGYHLLELREVLVLAGQLAEECQLVFQFPRLLLD